MDRNIEQGLACFERICLNIMCPNTTGIPPDSNVISAFMGSLYPKYRDEDRIDILTENTDFGVGY